MIAGRGWKELRHQVKIPFQRLLHAEAGTIAYEKRQPGPFDPGRAASF